MRKIIAYTCYYIGDTISKPMRKYGWATYLYHPYQWLMLKSYELYPEMWKDEREDSTD